MHLVYFFFAFLHLQLGKKYILSDGIRPSCLLLILNGFLKAMVVIIKSIDYGGIAVPRLMVKS